MMIGKIRKSRGFTLVELMIVVVIIGILAALAIFGVKRYVSNSKSAEARMSVGRIGKDAASAYEAERMGGNALALGSYRQSSRRLCASTGQVVPATLQADGEKYQPAASDWAGDGADAGWDCLKFSMDQAIYFQYDYRATASTTPTAGDGFTASAQAEMDGAFTQIFINGILQDDSGKWILTVAPSLCEASSTAAVTNPSDYNDGNCIL